VWCRLMHSPVPVSDRHVPPICHHPATASSSAHLLPQLLPPGNVVTGFSPPPLPSVVHLGLKHFPSGTRLYEFRLGSYSQRGCDHGSFP